MHRISSENYFTVQGWMVNDLDLKGNELMVYAIIYGFSQAEHQYFTGSYNYLASWVNATKRSIINVLNNLVKKGLLFKVEKKVGQNCKYCEYKAIRPEEKKEALQEMEEAAPEAVIKFHGGGEKCSPGKCKNFTGGGAKTSPNININKYINKNINKEEDKKKKSPPPSEDAKRVFGLYRFLCPSLREPEEDPKLFRKIEDSLKSHEVDDLARAFMLAEKSPFLRGEQNGRDHPTFKASLEFLLREDQLKKIFKGEYPEEAPRTPRAQEPKAMFMQGGTIYEDIEELLLANA